MKALEQKIRSRFQFDRLDEAMGSYAEFESLAKEIWNSAIDTASESAKLEHHPTTGNICIDKKAITDLKFKL